MWRAVVTLASGVSHYVEEADRQHAIDYVLERWVDDDGIREHLRSALAAGRVGLWLAPTRVAQWPGAGEVGVTVRVERA